MSPSPTYVKLPWPFRLPQLQSTTSPLSEGHPPPPSPATTNDLPPLNIPLASHFDCCLQASIHAPQLVSPQESPPPPPPSPKSPDGNTSPAPDAPPVANSKPASRRSGRTR
ncbi:hypothetical protein PCANC_05111 [Puccinia coronata f. sp. avenae]|uniref:Uncharacterized protein n=1 Tax=Puccinia coronata f. sp. avenae TaxID=200324 RepID=A0A2N5W358_9BASI|nr:hypothetical protein PCANC_05111 [Puccinia coronata f. sp. avenae]